MPFGDDSSINIDDFNSTADLEVVEETPIVTENFSKIPPDIKQFGKYEKGDGSMKTTEEVSEIPKEKKQGEVFKVAGFGKKTHVVTEDVSKIPTEKKQGGVFKVGGIGKKIPVVTEEVDEIPAEKKRNGRFNKGGGGKKITSGWSDKMELMESF